MIFSTKYIKYQYTVPKTWQNCNRVQHLIFLKVSAINKYSSYFFKKFFLAKVSILKNRIEKHVINLLKNLQEAALPIICNNTPAIVIYGQFQIYYIMGGMLLSSCFYLFPTLSFEKYPSFKLNLTYLTWKNVEKWFSQKHSNNENYYKENNQYLYSRKQHCPWDIIMTIVSSLTK